MSQTHTGSSPTAAPGQPVRGALIVLEGLDRSGKTTQVMRLGQRLVQEGHLVQVFRFPDRSTPIGQMIDSYLKSEVAMNDHVIHLLFSANRWEAVNAITAVLARGVTVLCDRYYYSGMVYSAAKQNAQLSLAWARAPEVGLPRPDLVVFLDLDEAQAKARGGWGDEVYEQAALQQRVRDLFWGLSFGRIRKDAQQHYHAETAAAAAAEEEKKTAAEADDTDGASPQLLFREEEEDLYVVDASGSMDEVAAAIEKVVIARVDAVARGEVGRVVRRVS